jgi:hypothetical protein
LITIRRSLDAFDAIVELQSDYWCKQFGALTAKAEVHALSAKGDS